MTFKLGIIGGSGLYAIDGMENGRWVRVATPWGEPSDDILTGRIAGVDVCFLPRHGRGHRIPPHQLNVRANIDALKRLGCTDLLAVSAVGSLNAAMKPGDFVVADQFIDRTHGRPSSFFETGLVAHVPMAVSGVLISGRSTAYRGTDGWWPAAHSCRPIGAVYSIVVIRTRNKRLVSE